LNCDRRLRRGRLGRRDLGRWGRLYRGSRLRALDGVPEYDPSGAAGKAHQGSGGDGDEELAHLGNLPVGTDDYPAIAGVPPILKMTYGMVR